VSLEAVCAENEALKRKAQELDARLAAGGARGKRAKA
jgi:hypothetical protein